MTALRNNVSLIGRLTKDPELRKTNSDIPVLNFSIAVDRPGTNKDNRITDFFDCVAWRGAAENISQYFHQGDPIGIHGSLQNDKYTDKDGNERKKVVVMVETFEFMPSRKQGTNETAEPEQNAPVPEPVPVNTDELPFDRGLVYP